jgi:hypothetical protein
MICNLRFQKTPWYNHHLCHPIRYVFDVVITCMGWMRRKFARNAGLGLLDRWTRGWSFIAGGRSG